MVVICESKNDERTYGWTDTREISRAIKHSIVVDKHRSSYFWSVFEIVKLTAIPCLSKNRSLTWSKARKQHDLVKSCQIHHIAVKREPLPVILLSTATGNGRLQADSRPRGQGCFILNLLRCYVLRIGALLSTFFVLFSPCITLSPCLWSLLPRILAWVFLLNPVGRRSKVVGAQEDG